MFPLLSLIIFLPLIGGIAILFLPKEQESAIRWTALGVAWANLMLVIGLVLGYAQVAVAGATSTFLFLFYVFWEVMLIPAYFLVGSWGGERRILDSHSANDATRLASDSGRVQGSIYAAFKFVLYTSVGSLLMLAGIIALGYYHQQAMPGSVYTLDLAALLHGNPLNNGIQI